MNPANPRTIFLRVALSVFVVVFGLGAAYALLLPRTYAASARVDLKSPAGGNGAAALQAQAAAAVSDAVLGGVVQKLGLNETWGRKIRVEGSLQTWESVNLLRQKLTVTPVDGASALEIRMDYADDGDQAARIANGVANACCAPPSIGGAARGEVTRRAQVSEWPEHPDLPLRLALTGVGAVIVALVSSGAAAWLTHLYNQAATKAGPTDKIA